MQASCRSLLCCYHNSRFFWRENQEGAEEEKVPVSRYATFQWQFLIDLLLWFWRFMTEISYIVSPHIKSTRVFKRRRLGTQEKFHSHGTSIIRADKTLSQSWRQLDKFSVSFTIPGPHVHAFKEFLEYLTQQREIIRLTLINFLQMKMENVNDHRNV